MHEESIENFILKKVQEHSWDLVAIVAKQFEISRQRAHYYVSKAVKAGGLIKTGGTRGSRYFLAEGGFIEFTEKIRPGLAEDEIWLKYVKPILSGCPQNIYSICSYGFSEIYNNAIDHSEGRTIFADVTILKAGPLKERLVMSIMDNGIGIFKKIQEALRLDSIKESILHLSKGKFTTDPSRHSGQGIFFTSRMFDRFSIFSGNLHYTFQNEEWLFSKERNEEEFGPGTWVKMEINLNSKREARKIFDQYADIDVGFTKTIVSVALSNDPLDPHASRSQAKRLVMGLEKFKTIVLDFKGVDSVGQAFVDQIFRVFQNEHPHIQISYIHANKEVDYMIRRGLVNNEG